MITAMELHWYELPIKELRLFAQKNGIKTIKKEIVANLVELNQKLMLEEETIEKLQNKASLVGNECD